MNNNKQEDKKPPNEVGKIKMSEMIKIVDRETKQVILEKKS